MPSQRACTKFGASALQIFVWNVFFVDFISYSFLCLVFQFCVAPSIKRMIMPSPSKIGMEKLKASCFQLHNFITTNDSPPHKENYCVLETCNQQCFNIVDSLSNVQQQFTLPLLMIDFLLYVRLLYCARAVLLYVTHSTWKGIGFEFSTTQL